MEDARLQTDPERVLSLKDWLAEEIRLVVPRYAAVGAFVAAIVLLFVALD